MPAVEEIDDLNKAAVSSNSRALASLAQRPAIDMGEFRDGMLDLEANMVALYKLAVLATKDRESVDEVAWIWKQTHDTYANALAEWSELLTSDPDREPVVEHYCKTLSRLKKVTAEHWHFHAE
jgi:hypothetical protein